MAITYEYWTSKRIERLENLLARHQHDVFAEHFLARLMQSTSYDQKRQLITEDLMPALQRADSMTRLWEGQEIPSHILLRDIVQDFLYHEHVIENLPTNERDTPEEAAERDRLARLFGNGEAASEMVIEDRNLR